MRTAVSRLRVQPSEARALVGQVVRFRLMGLDRVASGQKETSIEWSCTEGLGTLTHRGEFIARRAGTGTVTARLVERGVSTMVTARLEVKEGIGMPKSLVVPERDEEIEPPAMGRIGQPAPQTPDDTVGEARPGAVRQ